MGAGTGEVTEAIHRKVEAMGEVTGAILHRFCLFLRTLERPYRIFTVRPQLQEPPCCIGAGQPEAPLQHDKLVQFSFRFSQVTAYVPTLAWGSLPGAHAISACLQRLALSVH